jgi:HJR/Mrr/RecB family endonuclease
MGEGKSTKVPTLLKTAANGPLQQYVLEANERTEKSTSAAFKIAREMQERIDLFQSPVLKAALDMQIRADSFNLPTLRLALESQRKYDMLYRQEKTFLGVFHKKPRSFPFGSGLHKSSFLMSMVTSRASVFNLLSTLDLSGYNFQPEDADHLEIEEYQLDHIEDTEQEKKIIFLHEADRLKSTIQNIYRDQNLLYKIHDRDFEKVIAELLRNQQFEVELTKQTRDGGYDILAVQNLAGFPLRFLVECKRYAKNRPVGVNIIRSFSHVIHTEDANKGILFTTSYFSKDARQHGKKYMPNKLDFRDNQDILNWIKAYLNPITMF